MVLPEKFNENMKELLKNEFSDYEKSFDKERYYGLRANTLKISPEKLKDKFNEELKPVDWSREGFYYPAHIRPAKSPYYHAGLYYIQEPSAMVAASLLPVAEGDRVLDICAAPGGKSTHAGAKLKGTGLLVSNDISATRAKALLKNIELFGIKNACITNESPEKLSNKFTGFFDKILIDAPCSGEGMFRKDESAVKAWEEFKAEKCAFVQKEILYYAGKMLAEGGIISYSTCTFNVLENEMMIQYFLENNPDFSLMPIDHEKYGISKGMDLYTKDGVSLSGCGRIWPHKQNGEGHFIALLKHNGKKKAISPVPYSMPKIKDIEYFYEFCRSNLNIEIKGNLILHGNSIMLLPDGITDLKGLRVLRSGLLIGDLKTKRFEPSQAFAMSLKPSEAKNVIHFSLADEYLYRYLKGESFEVSAKEGYHLVCLDDYPLGWGKVVQGRLKNKYLKSWLAHNFA